MIKQLINNNFVNVKYLPIRGKFLKGTLLGKLEVSLDTLHLW